MDDNDTATVALHGERGRPLARKRARGAGALRVVVPLFSDADSALFGGYTDGSAGEPERGEWDEDSVSGGSGWVRGPTEMGSLDDMNSLSIFPLSCASSVHLATAEDATGGLRATGFSACVFIMGF